MGGDNLLKNGIPFLDGRYHFQLDRTFHKEAEVHWDAAYPFGGQKMNQQVVFDVPRMVKPLKLPCALHAPMPVLQHRRGSKL